MIYDVHAHCIPPAFREWIERSGQSVGASIVQAERGPCARFGNTTTAPMNPLLSDLERRIAEMDRMGVDVQLMAGWIDLTAYDLDPADGVEYSRVHNDLLAAEAASHPGRLIPMVTAPLQAPEAAAEELRRGMSELGAAGVQIATTVGDQWLDQAPLDPFWQAAEELGALVILHPMRPLDGVDLGRYFLDNMVGRPAETTIALAGLIFSGVFERYPDLRLCAVHGGGFVPFQIGRLEQGYVAKPGIAGRHLSVSPRESFGRVYVDTVVHDPAVVRFLIETQGADRVLLGTDYPFEMGESDPRRLLAELPDDVRSTIETHNPERLLGRNGQGPAH